MHDVLNSFKQNPSHKYCKNLINFEKPQKFSKTPKVRKKMHEMYDKEMEKRSYLWKCKKKTKERVEKMKKLRLRCLGEWETLFCQERWGRNERNSR